MLSPGFGIFNPVVTGSGSTPRGTYVRRWVPELAAVSTKHVHHPWDDTGHRRGDIRRRWSTTPRSAGALRDATGPIGR